MRRMKEAINKSRNIVAIMICLIGILCIESKFTLQSYAYTQTSGTVSTASAKVRAEANTTSNVLASVNQGQSLTIVDEVTGADGNTWYQVFVDASSKGFIRSDLVKKSQSSSDQTAQPALSTQVTAMDSQSGKVLTDKVRVRKEASTSSDVVATVGRGVAATVNGKATGTDGKTWYQVSFNYNNQTVTGFIRSDFITFEDLPEEAPEVTEISGTTGNSDNESNEEPLEEEAVTEPVEEAPVEEPATEEQPTQTKAAYELMNVDEEPKLSKTYTEVQLTLNNQTIRAWKSGEFYIFYAKSPQGNEGWYRFDSTEVTYQRYDAEAEGITGGLSSKTQTTLLIVLAVVIVVLIILLSILFMKLHDNKALDYEEDDDEEDEDEDPTIQKERAKSKWRALNFLTTDDFDDDEDEEDDDEDDEDDDEDEFVNQRHSRNSVPVRRPMQSQPRPMQSQPRPVQSQPRPVQGQPRPAQGQPRPVQGQPRPVQGQPRPVQGQPRPMQGQPRPVQGQPRPVQGQPRPVQGQPRPVQGQPRPVQGQRPLEGQPIRRTTQQPRKKTSQDDLDFFDMD